ncbi:hypothetical protein C8F04DRAFT_1294493 [Mycena alexandri]|uniref:Uncharacterized protein n=1 Tax=Mycena alexandri TaxID=1745969 RepID=A0AAD6SI37_9AGAR|nr:hypothetical protein C8F04DRAFT_1294493 [Mycena alexandri]
MSQDMVGSPWHNSSRTDPVEAPQTHGPASSSQRMTRAIQRDQRGEQAITCGATKPSRREIASPYPLRSPPPYVVPMLPLPLHDSRSSVGHTAGAITGCGTEIHPTVSRRQRKFPTTNDEATPTLAAATVTHPRFDLASWLSESYERHPAPSPTPSELQDITRQMDSESSERDDEQAAAAARLHGGVGSTPENSAVGSAAMAIPNTLDRNNSGVRVHFDR